jgi:hypothetical protein
MIDLSRVLEGGVLLKSIDKSVRKTRMPRQKISVDSVGSGNSDFCFTEPYPC